MPSDLPQLPQEVADHIEDAALVTAWGPGVVPRNGYGRREIEGMPVIEEPMRLVQQLGGIARGLLALGLSEDAAAGLTRRVALDSMPADRRAVLEALSTGEILSTAACARAAKLHRHVANFALEDLAAIGVVEHDWEDEEADDHVGTVNWQPRRRRQGDSRSVRRLPSNQKEVAVKRGYIPPLLPQQGKKMSSTRGQPTFVPPLKIAPKAEIRYSTPSNRSAALAGHAS